MPELPLRNLYWILIFSVSRPRSLEERVIFFFFVKKDSTLIRSTVT